MTEECLWETPEPQAGQLMLRFRNWLRLAMAAGEIRLPRVATMVRVSVQTIPPPGVVSSESRYLACQMQGSFDAIDQLIVDNPPKKSESSS
jgi:hypothetical protein